MLKCALSFHHALLYTGLAYDRHGCMWAALVYSWFYRPTVRGRVFCKRSLLLIKSHKCDMLTSLRAGFYPSWYKFRFHLFCWWDTYTYITSPQLNWMAGHYENALHPWQREPAGNKRMDVCYFIISPHLLNAAAAVEPSQTQRRASTRSDPRR